jgi:acyl carrier protein
MQPGDNQTRAVWEALWTSLDGSRYDVPSMKTTARENSHFVDDLGLDSLDLLEFYLRLDEEFNVSLTEDDYPKLTSVEATTAYLKAKAAQQ